MMIMIFSTFLEKRRVLNEQFKGKIEKILYYEKNEVSVKVNGQYFFLGSVRQEFFDKVRINDTIIKNKGNLYYVIITQNGKSLKF